jgi:hypothetical protein
MLLWRVVFCRSVRRSRHDPFVRAPWHPDRARVEAWADWFRRQGQQVTVQDNRDDTSRER